MQTPNEKRNKDESAASPSSQEETQACFMSVNRPEGSLDMGVHVWKHRFVFRLDYAFSGGVPQGNGKNAEEFNRESLGVPWRV